MKDQARYKIRSEDRVEIFAALYFTLTGRMITFSETRGILWYEVGINIYKAGAFWTWIFRKFCLEKCDERQSSHVRSVGTTKH